MIYIKLENPEKRETAWPVVMAKPWFVCVGSSVRWFTTRGEASQFLAQKSAVVNRCLVDMLALQGEVYSCYLLAVVFDFSMVLDFATLDKIRFRALQRQNKVSIYSINDLLSICQALQDYANTLESFWNDKKNTACQYQTNRLRRSLEAIQHAIIE